MNDRLLSGICPECGGTNICIDRDCPQNGEMVDVYNCADCEYYSAWSGDFLANTKEDNNAD